MGEMQGKQGGMAHWTLFWPVLMFQFLCCLLTPWCPCQSWCPPPLFSSPPGSLIPTCFLISIVILRVYHENHQVNFQDLQGLILVQVKTSSVYTFRIRHMYVKVNHEPKVILIGNEVLHNYRKWSHNYREWSLNKTEIHLITGLSIPRVGWAHEGRHCWVVGSHPCSSSIRLIVHLSGTGWAGSQPLTLLPIPPEFRGFLCVCVCVFSYKLFAMCCYSKYNINKYWIKNKLGSFHSKFPKAS